MVKFKLNIYFLHATLHMIFFYLKLFFNLIINYLKIKN